MIGMMANAARHEPEAVAALRAGRDDRMNRILRLPLPAPYTPTRVEALRDRLRSQRQPAKPSKPPRPADRKADRRSSRSASKGQAGEGIMEAHNSGTPAGTAGAEVAYWKVSATGERLGQRANRGVLGSLGVGYSGYSLRCARA